MAGGDWWKQSRKHLNWKEERASATVQIPGMKKEEEALDLIPAGKEDSASTTAEIHLMKREEALDLIRVGKESTEAATAEIIRTKKKEVLDLLRARKRIYEEAKPTGTEEKNGTDEEKKKRKKLVKSMFPQAAIDLLMTKRPVVAGVPDDVLAKYPQRSRDIYLINIDIKNKSLEYEQAIIDQYLQLGYAVDEMEVTDDEMEN